MTAAELAERIPGARLRNGGPWFDARCPAGSHGGDDRASLSFADDHDRGRVRLVCRKGCAFASIVAGLNLRQSAFFHAPKGATNGTSPAPERIVYDYRSEAGTIVHRTIRKQFQDGRKDFLQSRPDGKGGWLWTLDGLETLPYRLDRLRAELAALPVGQRFVAITEGEKDADALTALGIPATTNAMGAGKWKDHHSRALMNVGAEGAYVFRDADMPGEAHATAVTRSVVAAGLVARRVLLPGHETVLPKRGPDVSDWLRTHSADELRAVMAAARDEAPITEPAPALDCAPVVVRLSDVEPERVTWLWKGRIASGKVTLIEGDPGVGKSFLLADIAARLTTGREWPAADADLVDSRAPLTDVVLMAAEDGLADTLRPRLDAHDGDASRVHVLKAVKGAEGERPFSLARDLPALEQTLKATGARVLMIDPLSNYIGDRDSYKDTEVRAVLTPLVELASRLDVAVLALLHVGKAEGRRALHRAIGSVAFVALARIVLAVGRNPNDDSQSLVLPVKNNISRPAPALAFRIVPLTDDPDRARLAWESAPEGMSADEVLSPGVESTDERESRQSAAAFLMDHLADGERSFKDVRKAADDAGINRHTLTKVKMRLGIVSRRGGAIGAGGEWFWSLPEPRFLSEATPSSAADRAKTVYTPSGTTLGARSSETSNSSPTSTKEVRLHRATCLGVVSAVPELVPMEDFS